MLRLSGKSTDTGIAIGKAFIFRKMESAQRPCLPFDKALEAVERDLEVLAAENDIFTAHMEMAQDPLLQQQYQEAMESGASSEGEALDMACGAICSMFEELDDEYLRSRADDVRDVFFRIKDYVTGVSDSSSIDVPDGSVLVTSSLAPSDTSRIALSHLAGFVTEEGSVTSHVCIIARNSGICALPGTKGCMAEISEGDLLIVDSQEGVVLVNPDSGVLEEYRSRLSREESTREKARMSKFQPAITLSRRRVAVMANASSPEEVKAAMEEGADGIGLFRTEFVYMRSKDGFPSEQEQFEIYRDAVLACAGKPLTFRTLDIGGDKSLPYFDFPCEDNPFLGWRAIRISMDRPEMFKAQLRAILRASVYGNVRVMFPMISSVSELLWAKEQLSRCAAELDIPPVPVGIMVETPAAVIMAPELAEEAEFFSIGTNDLTQYVMAADRGNPSVARLYNPMDEAVLRCIKMVCSCPVEVGVCGEMASDPSAAVTLVNLGVDELSVSAPGVAVIKEKVRSAC